MPPLFKAGRSARMAGKLGVSMTDPPIRQSLPKGQPDVDGSPYHRMLRCILCLEGTQSDLNSAVRRAPANIELVAYYLLKQGPRRRIF